MNPLVSIKRFEDGSGRHTEVRIHKALANGVLIALALLVVKLLFFR